MGNERNIDMSRAGTELVEAESTLDSAIHEFEIAGYDCKALRAGQDALQRELVKCEPDREWQFEFIKNNN